MRSGLRKKNQKAIEEVVLRKKDNIIYVDFVLYSMVKSIDEKNYKDNKWDTNKKSYKFNIIRCYDRNKFNNYKTLGEERKKYLETIDVLMLIRRSV